MKEVECDVQRVPDASWLNVQGTGWWRSVVDEQCADAGEDRSVRDKGSTVTAHEVGRRDRYNPMLRK